MVDKVDEFLVFHQELQEVRSAHASSLLISRLKTTPEWRAFVDQLERMLDSIKEALIATSDNDDMIRKQGEARGIQRVLNLVASSDVRAADLVEESNALTSDMAAIGA